MCTFELKKRYRPNENYMDRYMSTISCYESIFTEVFKKHNVLLVLRDGGFVVLNNLGTDFPTNRNKINICSLIEGIDKFINKNVGAINKESVDKVKDTILEQFDTFSESAVLEIDDERFGGDITIKEWKEEEKFISKYESDPSIFHYIKFNDEPIKILGIEHDEGVLYKDIFIPLNFNIYIYDEIILRKHPTSTKRIDELPEFEEDLYVPIVMEQATGISAFSINGNKVMRFKKEETLNDRGSK